MKQCSNTLLQRHIDINCWYLNLLQLVPALAMNGLLMNNVWLVFQISYVLFHPRYTKVFANSKCCYMTSYKTKVVFVCTCK